MNRILYAIMTIGILLSACQDTRTFEVNGQITSAEDKIIYLEALTLSGISPIDSARLDKDGEFSFQSNSPEGPEFFRLRIDQHIVNLCIDSTEQINVTADYSNMSTDYDIKGSYNCERMKELAFLQMKLENEIKDNEASLDRLRKESECMEKHPGTNAVNAATSSCG